MKVPFIFISIFVLFNVFEYHISKYLLVNVEPESNGDNIDTWKGIGLQKPGNDTKLMPKI